jgi:hypothetical protein
MRKKNEIEQELNEKELDADLHKDLNSHYSHLEVLERVYKDKNPYVIGALNFLTTLFSLNCFSILS